MKVYPSEESDKDQGKRIIEPPIPFERQQKREMSKNDYITFKLRSTPADSNSTTYEFTIPYFDGSESPEETLDFIRDVRRAYKGQNVNDGSGRFALIRRLLRGDALAAFEREVDKNGGGDTTKEEYTLAVQGLIGHMFPVRALLTQRRAMRRIMRKPVGTTMKVYMARLTEINHKLANFPPFEPNQMLTEGELLDIGEFGTPPKWRKQMVLQNFDPLAGDTEDLVQFCQRMEATERSDTKRSKTALLQKIPKRKRGGARANKWCPVCDRHEQPHTRRVQGGQAFESRAQSTPQRLSAQQEVPQQLLAARRPAQGRPEVPQADQRAGQHDGGQGHQTHGQTRPYRRYSQRMRRNRPHGRARIAFRLQGLAGQ